MLISKKIIIKKVLDNEGSFSHFELKQDTSTLELNINDANRLLNLLKSLINQEKKSLFKINNPDTVEDIVHNITVETYENFLNENTHS